MNTQAGNCYCDIVTGSSSTQPKEPPKEAPSKSTGSYSRGSEKKSEFSFQPPKYVHHADFSHVIVIASITRST